MKLPPYITKQYLDEVKYVLNLVKTKERKYVPLAKKMILIAAYGTMIIGKISFGEFINNLRNHLQQNNSIADFWQFTYKAKYQSEKRFFGIPYKTVYEERIQTIEKAIIDIFYGTTYENSYSDKKIITRDNIKPGYKQYVKQMFQI